LFGLLKRLLQPAAAPAEKPVEFVDLVVPDMGDKPFSMTERQREYLHMGGVPVPDNLSEKQASLVLACINYVRYLFEKSFQKPTNHCPHDFYLRMLPTMLERKDIRDHILKWDHYMYKVEDSEQHPFRHYRGDPLHLEIKSAFLRAANGRASY
jgi:hypothetical protein